MTTGPHIPPRPDKRFSAFDAAIAMLAVLGGGILLVVLITLLVLPFDMHSGHGVRPLDVALLLAMLGIGAALLWLARALSRGAAWARSVSLAVLVLAAFAAATLAALSAMAPNPREVDGPAYSFMSGVMMGAGCLVGAASLLRRPRR
jgi:hypothetical protein